MRHPRPRHSDLDDYHVQDEAPSFSKGIARVPRQSVYAKPKPRNVFFSATKNVDNSSSINLAGANSKRVFLSIINNSAGTVWLGFGVVADPTGINSVKLLGNTSISFDSGIVPNNDINAIAAAGQCFLTVLEGNEQT